MSAWISQAEADSLLAMEKHRADESLWRLPDLGGGIVVPLTSPDGAEAFHLDVTRCRIKLAKGTLQTRGRTTLILARLDFGGPPHRNPDDEEISSPHLHLYREGYGDKWAASVPTDCFTDLGSSWQTVMDFLGYCNVTNPPHFDRGLFT